MTFEEFNFQLSAVQRFASENRDIINQYITRSKHFRSAGEKDDFDALRIIELRRQIWVSARKYDQLPFNVADLVISAIETGFLMQDLQQAAGVNE